MTEIATNVQRDHELHTEVTVPFGVLAGENIVRGALTFSTAAGLASADPEGNSFEGICTRPYDNTDGASGSIHATNPLVGGTRYCEVDVEGSHSIKTEGSPVAGQVAVAVDNNTVTPFDEEDAATPIVGIYRRPNPLASGEWFVHINRTKV